MKNVSPVKALVIGGILEAVGVVIFMAGTMLGNALAVVGIAVIAGGVIFCSKYYRCPYCGKKLGRVSRYKIYMPGFCQHCGRQYTGFAEPPEQKPEEVDYEPWRKFK